MSGPLPGRSQVQSIPVHSAVPNHGDWMVVAIVQFVGYRNQLVRLRRQIVSLGFVLSCVLRFIELSSKENYNFAKIVA